MDLDWGLVSALIGLLGLIFALILFAWIRRQPAGTDLMKEIADTIHHGAMVFLRREYSILVIFVVIVFLLLAWRIRVQTGFAFRSSGVSSTNCG